MSAGTKCPICHGSGEITEWKSGKRVRRECPECDGLGVVRQDWYGAAEPDKEPK